MTVHVIENFISQNEADEIINLFRNRLVHVDTRPGYFEDPISCPIMQEEESLKQALENGLGQEIAFSNSKFSGLMNKMKQFMENFYNINLPAAEGRLGRLVAGASNGLHADMYQSNGTRWESGPRGESTLEYSALLYLSEYGRDFSGGEIMFPQHKLTIKPRVGMLIFFRGDREHFHKVLEVTEGERHCIASFFGKSL